VLSGLPYEVLDAISARDFLRCMETVAIMLTHCVLDQADHRPALDMLHA
jgi:hypothetical protein